ncbi:hypothetical protein MHB42_10770 [Lysinibacillus sp. FSL K6-0232]
MIANLMVRGQLPKMLATIVAKYGKLDVLVNSAYASKQAVGAGMQRA